MSTVLVQEDDFYFFVGIKVEEGDDWPIFARFVVVVSMKQRNKGLNSDPYRLSLVYEALGKIQNFLQLRSHYVWCVEGILNGMKSWHVQEPDDGEYVALIDLRDVNLIDSTLN